LCLYPLLPNIRDCAASACFKNFVPLLLTVIPHMEREVAKHFSRGKGINYADMEPGVADPSVFTIRLDETVAVDVLVHQEFGGDHRVHLLLVVGVRDGHIHTVPDAHGQECPRNERRIRAPLADIRESDDNVRRRIGQHPYLADRLEHDTRLLLCDIDREGDRVDDDLVDIDLVLHRFGKSAHGDLETVLHIARHTFFVDIENDDRGVMLFREGKPYVHLGVLSLGGQETGR